MILALGLVWASLIFGYFMFLPYASYFGPSPSLLSWLGSTAALGVLGIPIFLLMMWLTRWFSSYRLPATIKSPLRIGWFASLMVVLFMGFEIATDHNESVSDRTKETYSITDDVIHITEMKIEKPVESRISRLFLTQYSKKGLVNDNVYIKIHTTTESKDIVIEQEVQASGRTTTAAMDRIKTIDAEYTQQGNTFSFPSFFYVNKMQKLRDQEVKYHIYIPKGKKVKFDRGLHVSHHTGFEEYCGCRVSDYEWEMGPDGLFSQEWRDKYRATKEFSLSTISHLNVEGNLDVVVKQGAEYKAILKGRTSDFDRIDFIETEGAVSFMKNDWFRGKPRLEVTVPTITSINVKDSKSLTIDGLQQKDLEVIHHGGGKLNMYIDIENLRCELEGSSSATLIGSGKHIDLDLNNTRLNAEKYKVDKVKLTGYVRSNSSLYANEEIKMEEHLTHSIDVFGDPEIIKIKRE